MSITYKTVLSAKLHGIEVIKSSLNYEGSCAIPDWLMTKCNIDHYEQIHVYNINNGMRFITYAIPLIDTLDTINGVHMLGAAARCTEVGDKVIIAVYRSIPVDHRVSPLKWP